MKFKKRLLSFLTLMFFTGQINFVLAEDWGNVLPGKLDFSQADTDSATAPYKENEVLVKYKKNIINPNTAAGKIRKNNFESQSDISEKEKLTDAAFLYDIKDNSTVDEKIEEFEKNPAVDVVQPNYIYKSTAITPPNDPGWRYLWGLSNFGQSINSIAGTSGDDMKWLYAWDKYKNDPNSEKNPVIVADIDTGFDYNHPDVNVNNLWDGSACKDENGNYLGGCKYGYDYDYNKKDPKDADMSTHGTCTGGIIAAAINNGVGLVGMNPGVKLMSIKSDMQSGGNPGVFNTASITKSIKFAAHNGAKIINMSFGGAGANDPLLASAIGNFPGLVVAAAGNDSANNDITPIYPCNLNATLSNVICVGATDQNDALAALSNYGTNSIDVAAPGNNIYVLYYDPNNDDQYASGDGTSLSAPYASGLASLLWGYKSSLTTAQVKNAILNTGDVKTGLSAIRQISNGTDTGGRRINAYNALLSIDPMDADIVPPSSPSGLSVR